MPKILLTRHGHVEGISPERFRGQAELALTEKGLSQAAALAERIAANGTQWPSIPAPCSAALQPVKRSLPKRERLLECSRVSSISITVHGNGILLMRSGTIRPLSSLYGILRRISCGFPKVTPCRTCSPVRQTPSALSWNIIVTRQSFSLDMRA